MAAAVLPAVAAAPAAADPGPCPSLYVVAVPGTWETADRPDGRQPGPGMLSAVTRGLPSSVRTDYVTYAATAFPREGEIYGRSKAQAISAARGMIGDMARTCADTDIALLGYSQGADAAGDLAAEIGSGAGVIPADRLVAVGLLSDPRRSETDNLVGPRVPGSGAAGARPGGFGWATPSVVSICATGDLYCSTEKDDFVTRLSGFLALSSGGPVTGTFTDEALALWHDLWAAGGLPVLAAQFDKQANNARVDQLTTFYSSQVHHDYSRYVVDGQGTTALQWMKSWLRAKA